MIFQNKKMPFQDIKARSSNSRKIDIFRKGLAHGFVPKTAIFLIFFFLGNIGQDNVFHDILEQKNAFVGYKKEISFTFFYDKNTRFQAIKTKCLKNRKIDNFVKGLNHGLGPKMVIFTTFFVGNIGHVNVFYDILERKNAFLGYKNKNFKISKKCHFSKVVNPRFWFRNSRFFQFFFWTIQARTISFTIFQNKKRFSRL